MSVSRTYRLRMASARTGRQIPFLALLACVLALVCALPAAAGAATYRPWSLEDVDFISAKVGWAVGTPGAVYTTTNGGNTWIQRPYGGTDWLTGVDFVNSQKGWAVGAHNEGDPLIMHSQDGGRHWAEQTSPVITNWFTDVAFTNTSTGCVVGTYGTILQTTNGGDTWVQVVSGTSKHLEAVVLRNTGVGYAVGASGVTLKTVNFGATWTPLSRPTTKNLRGVAFVTDLKGWVVGVGGVILKTANGGVSWTKEKSGTTQVLDGLAFADSKHGWAVGGNGVIVRTTNGGTSWKQQVSGTKAFLFAVACSGAKGWTVGELERPLGSDPYAYGVIRRTLDGGATWKKDF